MEHFAITGNHDTIAAVATPTGTGGIAVIRVSGPDAISIADAAWSGRSLADVDSHTAHLGRYRSVAGGVLDEAVATVFRNPGSFTGEDVVEIALHGSRWIQREVLNDLVRRGARVAGPGEFTQRAFINGKLDLAQAEGVADLIAASSRAAHDLAMAQTRGNFSRELERLRERLVEFASLLELELDFSEEDVEFADRSNLLRIAGDILLKVDRLAASYSSGAAIKEGIPVVIAGIPNAGKSSLLNLLLGDDKALVSDIPGTTRDTIEDTLEIEGILYRFIDTAGLRNTSDTVERMGIDRARKKMQSARIVIWIVDPTSAISPQVEELNAFRCEYPDVRIICIVNKSDLAAASGEGSGVSGDGNASLKGMPEVSSAKAPLFPGEDDTALEGIAKVSSAVVGHASEKGDTALNDMPDEGVIALNGVPEDAILFSTKTGDGLDTLILRLAKAALGDINLENELIVTNSRHYEALIKGSESLQRAIAATKEGISADFIAQDVREALHHLGTITGTVTTDNLLHSIFSRFCIGK